MKQNGNGKIRMMETLFAGVGYEAVMVLGYSVFLFLLLCFIMR